MTHPVIAEDIIDTWRHFAGERYQLCAWVIMPNHVHVVITVMPDHTLAAILQSWKSWTGKGIKAHTGTIRWQRDYWDRYIRDEAHYRKTVSYVLQNPVKAGLCAQPHDWPWSSANPRKGSPSSPSKDSEK